MKPRLCGVTIQRRLAVSSMVVLAACDGVPEPVTRGGAPPVQLESSAVTVVGSAPQLAAVRDLSVRSDGTIWTLNSIDPYFVVFDSAGSLVDAWGASGGGPEEFDAPSALVLERAGDDVWAYDETRHAFVDLTDGRPAWSAIDGESLPPRTVVHRSFFTRIPRLAWGEGRVLLARSKSPDQSPVALWDADLVAVDLQTGAAELVLELGTLLEAPTAQSRAVVRFLPYPLWSACGEDRIVVYDPNVNALRSFDLDGAESESLALPPPQRTTIDLDELVDAMLDDQMAVLRANGEDAGISRDMLREALRDRLDGVSGVYPEYVEMHCASDDTVWIQPFDLESGHFAVGPTWLRVAASGSWEEIRMPDRFEPHRFTNGRVWGVLLDEYDVPSVAWIGSID